MMTMNKKMRELKEKMEAKTNEAKSFLSGENKDVDKATAILNEVDDLKKEFEAEKRLFEMEQAEAENAAGEQLKKKGDSESTKKFASTVRAMVHKTVTPMSEGVNADGGYTVPEDISTEIEKYPVAAFSVEPYITTENVKTNKGARTYEKKGTVTPFADVDEGGAIPAVTTPKFERKTYAIGDKGGYIPITNDLLNDSDAGLKAYLVGKLGEKRVATINDEFFTAMTDTGEDDPVAIASLADIKKIINVTVGSAYNSLIMVNDDGWNWLDCLEDKNGRPLLTPYGDSDNRIGKLSIGGSVVRVIRVPNTVWPSGETAMPIIIGDTKAAFKRFDRLQMEIKISDVASVTGFNAFEQNGALIRAFMRDDSKVWDADAFVYGEIAFPSEDDDEEETETETETSSQQTETPSGQSGTTP